MNTRTTQSYLLVGGLGYIGGHTALALHDAGQRVSILDNLSTSHASHWQNLVQHIPEAQLWEGDARSLEDVENALQGSEADTVIHFAALKSVPESVANPLLYHRHNTEALLTVLEAMERKNVRRLVFSSSAAVYGETKSPITEGAVRNPTSPYGATKLAGERILQDLAASDNRWAISALRYFNPIGADPFMRHGEYVSQGGNVAAILSRALMQGTPFTLTGDDFPTPDKSGMRDYLHVYDLAVGHIHAAQWLRNHPGYNALNVGTGQPVSVKQLIAAFEKASTKTADIHVLPRRPGDVAACWADNTAITEMWGWKAHHDLEAMAQHHWEWAMRDIKA